MPKTDRLDVRCKPAEYGGWQKLAAKAGLTLSDWVRRILNGAKK